MQLTTIQAHPEKKLYLLANATRQRPINVDMLHIDQQKEFFRLDHQFEQTFVDKNHWKVSKKPNQFIKGLEAQLVKDRKQIFKTFVRDENKRNNEYFQVLFETEANKAGELKLRNATYSITPRAT